MRRRQEHACTTHGLQADSLLTENLDLSWNDFTIGSGHIEGYGGRRGSRYATVGMETSSPVKTSSPVISMNLISAGYGDTVPETLRLNPNLPLPERRYA